MVSNPEDAVPPARPQIVLQRTCPACGAKFPAVRDFCPECNAEYLQARGVSARGAGPQASKAWWRTLVDLAAWGVPGGLLLIVVAVGWFVAGWLAGVLYVFPVFFLLLGIVAVWRGLNSPGRRPPTSRRRKGRSG